VRLSNAKTKRGIEILFLQAFNTDKIEKDVYRLNKPYFEILVSLESENHDFLKKVEVILR
jgi:hypothetical protein